jgi:hypothetical protein
LCSPLEKLPKGKSPMPPGPKLQDGSEGTVDAGDRVNEPVGTLDSP